MGSVYSSIPPTSSAVNIQIIEPKNYAGGAVPGQIVGPGGQQFAPNGAPASYPTNYNNLSAANPQQALQNAYLEAMNARNIAEQARNSYLNMANGFNGQAYQQQMTPQPQPPTFAVSPQQFGPPQMFPQQFPQQFPPQMMVPPGAANPFAPQLPPTAPMDQAQAQAPQPPAEAPAPEQPQEPAKPSLKSSSVEDLNRMIEQPATLQERIDAMEEVGVRGNGSPQTYELLRREALADTSHLSGQSLNDANYVRQAALWTTGMLNKAQNGNVPTDKLPGIDAIQSILKNKNENSDVRAAAIQALQVINRPNDKTVKKLLKNASKDKHPRVRDLAKEVMAGKTLDLSGV